MRRHTMIAATVRSCVLALGLLTAASPARAQWTRVADLPASDVFAVSVRGDTIVAGTNTLVYSSLNAGATWTPSSPPGTGVPSIRAVLMRNGRLYAGTAGQGVFVSDDLGQTWSAFNQGLVGGLFNSQLDIADLALRGDSLYAATLGAGVYVRDLAAGTWSHFGEEFEPNQASNVQALAVGGTRLLAGAGANGTVFFREPGDADWTRSFLDNVGLRPGLQAVSAAWTGARWAVGVSAGRGVFTSLLGQEPWTFVNLNLGPLSHTALAPGAQQLFGAFDVVIDGVFSAVIEESGDDGLSWQVMDVLPNAFVYRMAAHDSDLYAGRTDGLWRRSTGTVSVPDHGAPGGLRFALAGPQPVVDVVRLRFELPEAGIASIAVFDVAGRLAADLGPQSWSAGPHEISWDARGLAAGVYAARLEAGGRQEVVRIVRVR